MCRRTNRRSATSRGTSRYHTLSDSRRTRSRWWCGKQQVVALDDDHARGGIDRDCVLRPGLSRSARSYAGHHTASGASARSCSSSRMRCWVEGLGDALQRTDAARVEHGIGQMKPVHGHVDRARPARHVVESRHEALRERALARGGRARDAEQKAPRGRTCRAGAAQLARAPRDVFFSSSPRMIDAVSPIWTAAALSNLPLHNATYTFCSWQPGPIPPAPSARPFAWCDQGCSIPAQLPCRCRRRQRRRRLGQPFDACGQVLRLPDCPEADQQMEHLNPHPMCPSRQ